MVFGGEVVRADRLMHGKTSPIHHDGSSVFKGLPDPFDATRYHSLIVKKSSLPDELRITAWTEEGEIMGLQHKELEVHGVQFHPESILTTQGKKLLQNFLDLDFYIYLQLASVDLYQMTEELFLHQAVIGAFYIH